MGFFFIGLLVLIYCAFNEGIGSMDYNYNSKLIDENRVMWDATFKSQQLTKDFFSKYNLLGTRNYDLYKQCIEEIKEVEKRYKASPITSQFIEHGLITGDIFNEDELTLWGCDFILSEHGKVPYERETYCCVGGNKLGIDGYHVMLSDTESLIALKWIQDNLKPYGAGDIIYTTGATWVWKERDAWVSSWNHREYNRRSLCRQDKKRDRSAEPMHKYWYYTLDEYLTEKFPYIMRYTSTIDTENNTDPCSEDDNSTPPFARLGMM